MNKFKDNLIRYVDAGFPILFVNSFEEEKVLLTIHSLFNDRQLLFWNIRGLFDLQSNAQLLDSPLADTLDFFLQDNDSIQEKIVILTGITNDLDDENVIERLKLLAQKINNGELNECSLIILSPTIKIPVALEKYIIILTLEQVFIND